MSWQVFTNSFASLGRKTLGPYRKCPGVKRRSGAPARSAGALSRGTQVLRVSEARLADLRTGKRPPEIDVTQAELQQALTDKKEQTKSLRATTHSIRQAESR